MTPHSPTLFLSLWEVSMMLQNARCIWGAMNGSERAFPSVVHKNLNSRKNGRHKSQPRDLIANLKCTRKSGSFQTKPFPDFRAAFWDRLLSKQTKTSLLPHFCGLSPQWPLQRKVLIRNRTPPRFDDDWMVNGVVMHWSHRQYVFYFKGSRLAQKWKPISPAISDVHKS